MAGGVLWKYNGNFYPQDARFTSYLNNESKRVRLESISEMTKTLKATVKYLELGKEYNVSPVTLAISYSKHFDFVAQL